MANRQVRTVGLFIALLLLAWAGSGVRAAADPSALTWDQANRPSQLLGAFDSTMWHAAEAGRRVDLRSMADFGLTVPDTGLYAGERSSDYEGYAAVEEPIVKEEPTHYSFVPEPGTMALLGLGLAVAAARRKNRANPT